MTDEELIKLLREWSDGMSGGKQVVELVQAADRIEALTAEVERKSKALRTGAEWIADLYAENLTSADRIEALTAALVEIRACTTEHGGAAKALRIINAALEKKP